MRTPSFSGVLVATGLLSILVTPVHGKAPILGSDGGFTLSVAFDYPSLVDSGKLPTDFDEAQFCEQFTDFSHRLWQATDGQHYLKEVDFRVGTHESDINYFFRGGTSYGSFNNSIVFNASSSYSDLTLAFLLTHEFGHYAYSLKDEYVHSRRGGSLGMCQSWVKTCSVTTSQSCSVDSDCPSMETCETPDQDACDDDSDCPTGDACILQEKRTGETDEPSKVCADYEDVGANDFTACETDADCSAPVACVDDAVLYRCTGLPDSDVYCHDDTDCLVSGEQGVCMVPSAVSTRRVCYADASMFPGDSDPDNHHLSSLMGGSSLKAARWCDATTHVHEREIARGTTFDVGGSGDPDFELTFDEAAYTSTWDRAARTDLDAATDADSIPFMDLHDYYDGTHSYPAWANFSRADFETQMLDGGSSIKCNWLIDSVPLPGSNTIVLVDASGSMDYKVGASTLEKTAFTWAAEGAALLLENADPTNWIGITTYNAGSPQPTGTNAVQPFVEASTLSLGDDIYDDIFGDMEPQGSTDMGQAISVAVAEIVASGVGIADRNIILMSDGKNTEQNGDLSPLEGAAEALAAGVKVNTLEYGDADSAALQEIADATGGVSLIVGAKTPTLGLVADPQSLKTDFVRAQHKVNGMTQLYENYFGDLLDSEPLREETFFVPTGSNRLVFDWITSDLPFCIMGSEHCYATNTFTHMDFWLVSPSGVIIAGTKSSLLAAVANVTNPEVGVWSAFTDSTELPGIGFVGTVADGYEIGPIREASRVTTVANVDHSDLQARAWVAQYKHALTDPVTINASLTFKVPLTHLGVGADVFHDGIKYGTVWMYDDGAHDDNEAGDGVFGGIFNPDGALYTPAGKYAVVVRMLSLTGISVPVEGEPFGDEIPEPLLDEAPNVLVETEAFFHLSNRYGKPTGHRATWAATIGFSDVDGPIPPTMTVGKSGKMMFLVSGMRVSPDTSIVTLGPGVDVTQVDVVATSDTFTTLKVEYNVAATARAQTNQLVVRHGLDGAITPIEVLCGDKDLAPPQFSVKKKGYKTCGESVSLVLPRPTVSDDCSRPKLAGYLIQNGGQQVTRTLVSATKKTTLSIGTSIIEWVATDKSGNETVLNQSIEVVPSVCLGKR